MSKCRTCNKKSNNLGDLRMAKDKDTAEIKKPVSKKGTLSIEVIGDSKLAIGVDGGKFNITGNLKGGGPSGTIEGVHAHSTGKILLECGKFYALVLGHIKGKASNGTSQKIKDATVEHGKLRLTLANGNVAVISGNLKK